MLSGKKCVTPCQGTPLQACHDPMIRSPMVTRTTWRIVTAGTYIISWNTKSVRPVLYVGLVPDKSLTSLNFKSNRTSSVAYAYKVSKVCLYW